MTRAGALGVALLAWGCGSKGAVTIVGDLVQPSAAVGISLIQRTLSGGAKLHVELGQYAPSGTDVTIQGALSLVKPSDQSTLVVLKMSATPMPPYHLDPGGKSDAMLTIGEGSPPVQNITQAESDAICAAKTLEITGTLTDTASGNPTPVTSPMFDVTGCP